MGMFSFPFCDWCPLRGCSLSPSGIGARYGYTLFPSPSSRHPPTSLPPVSGLLCARCSRALLVSSPAAKTCREGCPS
eukprot:4682266-Pyramimonas_sp.AAC.1